MNAFESLFFKQLPSCHRKSVMIRGTDGLSVMDGGRLEVQTLCNGCMGEGVNAETENKF